MVETRPDIMFVDKKKKKNTILNVVVPGDVRVRDK